MSKYLCRTSNVYLRACECLLCKSVYVFVHACGGKCVLCERGAQRGDQLCAGCRLWGGGGAREGTCRPCVWEPRAPHFSYIVLLLLQTVNATKDAQLIVARDSWGGRAMGWRQAREEGSGLAWAWHGCLDYLLSFPVLSPLSSPVLSSTLLFSRHSALPLSPSQEDLAGRI